MMRLDALPAVVVVRREVSSLELATPFLITILLLVILVVVGHEITARVERHYTQDWTSDELESVDAHRSPRTYALASMWVMDAAQIPAVFLAPIAGVLALRKAYPFASLLVYTAMLAFGLMVFFYFIQQVNITRYAHRGIYVFGYRVGPIVLGGICLNVVLAALTLTL